MSFAQQPTQTQKAYSGFEKHLSFDTSAFEQHSQANFQSAAAPAAAQLPTQSFNFSAPAAQLPTQSFNFSAPAAPAAPTQSVSGDIAELQAKINAQFGAAPSFPSFVNQPTEVPSFDFSAAAAQATAQPAQSAQFSAPSFSTSQFSAPTFSASQFSAPQLPAPQLPAQSSFQADDVSAKWSAVHSASTSAAAQFGSAN